MDQLRSIFFSSNSEQEYIDCFCKEYKDPIQTPDGFTVYCKNIEGKASHFCCGSTHKFQMARAQRILWAKYILLNLEVRIIL